MTDKGAVVITTIQKPTKTVLDLSKSIGDFYDIIVVGDKKSPDEFFVPNVRFISVEKQENMLFKLSKILPFNHYCRKNIGYLEAIKSGSEFIIETDDDNFPYVDFGQDIKKEVSGEFLKGKGWYNVYSDFTTEHIWPRGFPLDDINKKINFERNQKIMESQIQQFLADGDPDVDAVYRLTVPFKEIKFDKRQPVILDKGLICPYNSQNTLTFKEAFPLLYLPSFVTFRMTDIWRGLISQSIMWSLDWNLSFHRSTVFQERNVHNLIKDFEKEIPGYMQNKKIMDVLGRIQYLGSTGDRLKQAYSALIKEDIIPQKEMELVNAWADDLENLSIK